MYNDQRSYFHMFLEGDGGLVKRNVLMYLTQINFLNNFKIRRLI